MTGLREILTMGLIGVGLLFFLAGLVGLRRFPDAPSRLHALTKADNLGLGFVVAGLAVHHAWDVLQLKLLLVYLLALGAASMNGYLIAQRCWLSRGEERGTP